MKRKIALAVLAVILVFCLVLAAACEPKDKTEYTITIGKTANGTVKASAEKAKEGTTVTLTVTPDAGYVLKEGSLKYNDTAISGTSFTMPAANVTVTAEFVQDMTGVVQETVDKTVASISASTLGSTATAYFTTVFGTEGITFTAHVEDGILMDADGMEVRFALEKEIFNTLLPDGETVAVKVTADGTVSVQTTDAEGKLVALTEGASGSYARWTEDGASVTGYKVTVTVDYDALGVTAETAKGYVTICPVLYNANSALGAVKVLMSGDMNEDHTNTYKVIDDDNTYSDNAYVIAAGQLGSLDYVKQGEYWDTTKDYYASNPEYANRVVTLTGHDNADNNLAFFRVSAPVMYVRATFKLTSITNANEQYGKFGLMLFDGAPTTGLMYYVDAFTQKTNSTLADIKGTDLGINNSPTGLWNSWVTVKNGVFDLSDYTITLEMVYQNGYLHLYADGELAHSLYYGAYNSDMHFGIKSFGFGMEVTNYLASDDPEGDGWTDKMVEVDKQDVNTLFLGDSYMEFWKNSGIAEHVAQLPSYANEGVGGTKVNQWTERVAEMAMRYNPENIVFHIGVNDVDDDQVSANVTYTRLMDLFDNYHEVFPQATIYWVSLIPNEMFSGNTTTYNEVNASVQQYAQDNASWLKYIDATTPFTAADGGARTNMFYDGLHLNREYGYPLWAKAIMTALGYQRTQGANLGDGDTFAYSDGWEFIQEGEYAHNDGVGEQAVWVPESKGADVYAEFEATLSGTVYNNDGYPKFGPVVRTDDVTVFGYIDAVGLLGGNGGKGTNIVYRPNKSAGTYMVAGDWNWNDQPGGTAMTGEYTGGTYVKMALAKYDNTIVLWVNDVLVCRIDASYIGADDVVEVGFIGFNLEMTVKNTYVTTDSETVHTKVYGADAADAVIDGVADDEIYTSAVVENTHSFGTKADGKTHFELMGVKGTDGLYFVAKLYSAENTRTGNAWYEHTNVEFRLGTDNATQQYFYFDEADWTSVKSSAAISRIASDGGVLQSDGEYAGMYIVTVEFFVPYANVAGYEEGQDPSVKAWGWVQGTDGWQNAMNVGTWGDLRITATGLRFRYGISVSGTNSALTVNAPQGAYVGDTVTLDVQVTDGQTLAYVKVNGEEIEAQEGTYFFVMPNEAVAVEVALEGISVSTDVIAPDGLTGGQITTDKATAVVGETVQITVTLPGGAVLKTLTVNGEQITVEQGVLTYDYTVKAGDEAIAIVATLDYDTEGYEIDGTKGANEQYGEPISFKVEDNRQVTLYAVKGANGIYFYLEAYTNTNINNAAEWHLNHNFEFYLNNGAQSYVNSKNERKGATKSVWTTTLVEEGDHAGKYLHVTELFVHKSAVGGAFEEDVLLNWAFKAPGETARWEGMSNNQWNRGDWWNYYVGGADGNIVPQYGQAGGRPTNLYITVDGLESTLPVAQHATLDGELTEYEGKASLTVGNENAKFTVTGFAADDGLYLAFTILQKQTAAATPEWHLNDNLEIRVNSDKSNGGFSIFDDFIIAQGIVTDYGIVRTTVDEDGYTVKTVVEVFYAMTDAVDSYVQIGCNGNGFGGWQSLIWDNNYAYVTEDGVYRAADVVALDGITLDGVKDESLGTLSEVTGSFKNLAVTLSGKKLEHGVVLYVTVHHEKDANAVLQGNGTLWWNYLNVEFRLGRKDRQICASVFNGYTQFSAAGHVTTGEAGNYDTTFEVYVPYGTMNGVDISGNIEITCAVVNVDGWGNVFGAGVEPSTYVVTDSGVINTAA